MKFERELNIIKVFIYNKKFLNNDIDSILDNIIYTLDKYYNLSIENLNDVKIYINRYYGLILEIKKGNNYNIKILNDVLFLYEIDDPLEYLNNEIYFYNDKYYINFKKYNINILENAKIIYGDDVYKIIGRGIKLV